MEIRLVAVDQPPTLRHLDLRIGAGVTCVRGNAAQCASLVRLLALRSPPRAGRVLLAGQDVYALPPARRADWRRRIGFAPAGWSLPETVAVGRGLAYLAALWQVPGLRAVRRELETWGLTGLEGRRLGDLSPGERRRFVLAASRVMNPEVWILERPYDGVDRAAAATLDMLVADVFFGRGPVRTLVMADDSARAQRLPCHHRLALDGGAVAELD
jgi:ABC-type multidrug transport system ATPase subunit